MPNKEAVTICKTFLRNGFDAYIINANLQDEVFGLTQARIYEVACEADFETLCKLFPNACEANENSMFAKMNTESGALVFFYPIIDSESAHPDFSHVRVSPYMLDVLQKKSEANYNAIKGGVSNSNIEDAFFDAECGCIRLKGLSHWSLQRNYRLAITALRMAANSDLPIEPSTWLAILRSSHQISDFLPMSVLVEEMRLVSAKSLWKFIQLLSDSFILHAVLPEVAALHAIKQQRNKNDAQEITAFEHTIACMKAYPEDEFENDWLGVVGVLFQDIGKLYTAENYKGFWTFYQYHRVGAQITRGILKRMHFPTDEIDIVCNLVRSHIRFHSMMTDRGIRRFLALPETERLIAMTRAHIIATETSYTNFNHNLKYLERADTPEAMLEPLLNGNEIMEVTNLPQGRSVGIIRDALLEAQKAGIIKTLEEAKNFVCEYKVEEE